MPRVAAVFALLVLAVAAPSAAGATGPCLGARGGPTCHFWSAKVVSVDDGDTIHVDLAGDRSARALSVRFSSVQAMEQTVYGRPGRRRGECHAIEATARLERLIRRGHGRVRLSAQDPASRSDSRLRRNVAVRIGGRWVDLGERLTREGHTLWLAGTIETAWNARYNRAEQLAARDGRRLWNPTHCGVGPAQDIPVRIWVNWDSAGKDTANLQEEWIKIRSESASAALDLGGWWVRDSNHRRYRIPSDTLVAPGATLTVYTGRGADSAAALHWGLSEPIFENPGDERDLGDGAYLFDPQGDLRASLVYPCVVACADPLQGAVGIEAHPMRPESVLVRNDSSAAIDLYGYAIALPGSMYPFVDPTPLAPGRTLRFDIPGGRYKLPDGGGSVRLATLSDITLACDAWGSGRCD